MTSWDLRVFIHLSQIAITKHEMHNAMPQCTWQNRVFLQQIVSGKALLIGACVCVFMCVHVWEFVFGGGRESILSPTTVQLRHWQLNHRLLGQKEKNQWLLNSLCEVISKAVIVESQISTWLRAGVMQGPGEGNEVLCRGCFQHALGHSMMKMPVADKKLSQDLPLTFTKWWKMSISCNSLKSQADNPSAYNIVVSLDLNANMVQLIIVGDFITHNLNILVLNLIYLFLVLYGIRFGAELSMCLMGGLCVTFSIRFGDASRA